MFFLDLCKANRLGVNTLMSYEVQLRLYLLPVLRKRRPDQVTPADITAIKAALAMKARSTMTEVLRLLLDRPPMLSRPRPRRAAARGR